ncbi:hypothetical protein [Pseudomonas savastanoi]|nr:hypothetical protein [Pseudomonas savastanoi]RMR36180.1 hypothetical protein ALP91_200009 [Pseudomonas savastanoi pv. glycinea]
MADVKKENTYTVMRDMFENQMFEYKKSSSALTRQSALEGKQKVKGDHRPLYGALQIAKDSNAVGRRSYLWPYCFSFVGSSKVLYDVHESRQRVYRCEHE